MKSVFPMSSAESHSHTQNPLLTPVQFLKGVGPSRAELLERLGIRRAVDLLFHFPRDYQDFTDRRSIDQLQEKVLQTVSGTIEEWDERSTRRGPVTSLYVNVNEQYVRGVWFNIPFYIKKEFAVGRRVLLSGKPRYDPPYWVFTHPKLTYLNDIEEESVLEPILPMYPLTEGLRQHHLRRIIREQLKDLPERIEDVLPESFRAQRKLLDIASAVRKIHFPGSQDRVLASRRRFIFQELFLLQLGLAIRRLQHRTRLKAVPILCNPKIDLRIRQRFPYEMTKAQHRVIREIAADMERPIPMNRLLQGDVGTGKTFVALYAMLLAVAHGHQAVFMAPTEVLAKQHLRNFQRILEGSRTRIVSILGGQKGNERAEALQEIQSGQAGIIIGTQALLYGEIPFHKLGLVVIDEQHKFGVRQRAHLKTGTSFDPHYLVMTATPIPRSVTMTLFGDLDVSILDEFPPGRQKVRTRVAEEENRPDWWDFVRNKLDEGRQGFVVVPLVEESENFDAKNLKSVYEHLADGPLRGYRLGILHGRMSNEEKERVMLDFRSGEIQMLVSTTVIEVGVDVPNATLLTIESGERFGLAQLHQLRGRVGRGKHPGYCVVFAKKENEETQKRLKAFAATTDGFALAETDFEIRGPGELFGTQQHGLPPFRIADLSRDREVLLEAKEAAVAMVHEDPGLALPEHAALRAQVLRRYGAVLELGDVG